MPEKITIADGVLQVPNEPTIPFIEGDGTGVDIWPASKLVLDAAVAKAYGGDRQIDWREVLAGEKAFNETGNWLPDETLEAFREYLVGIKGPLTTPVGGGIRSLNVALRQILDLYVCLRPVRWFTGVPRRSCRSLANTSVPLTAGPHGFGTQKWSATTSELTVPGCHAILFSGLPLVPPPTSSVRNGISTISSVVRPTPGVPFEP